MPRKTETVPSTPAGRSRFNEAAARCRGKPTSTASRSRMTLSFNEAAARCRGKRCVEAMLICWIAASMRPRPDAAENIQHFHPPPPFCRRFNEAAARCRGKPSAGEDEGQRRGVLQ